MFSTVNLCELLREISQDAVNAAFLTTRFIKPQFSNLVQPVCTPFDLSNHSWNFYNVPKLYLWQVVCKRCPLCLSTCILVFTTSRGVFPKTLAAPAVAPNIAVTIGCISLLGSSPTVRSQNHKMDENHKKDIKWNHAFFHDLFRKITGVSSHHCTNYARRS